MSTKKRIAIVVQNFRKESELPEYMIWEIAQAWRKMGFDVRFVSEDDTSWDADFVVPHMNLTVTPKTAYDSYPSGAVVLNRKVFDVRKTIISRNLVKEGDPYTGPVIVKTDGNCGGMPERIAAQHESRALRIRLAAIDKIKSLYRVLRTGSFHKLARTKGIPPMKYPVYDSVADLPKGVFNNPDLVVEKFLPEMEDGMYCIRYYKFLGDAEVASRMKSTKKVVKGRSVSHLEEIEVHPTIRKIRHEMGLDYGKMDYVEIDGEAHLLDVTKAPTGGAVEGLVEWQKANSEHLATGISKWIPEMPASQAIKNDAPFKFQFSSSAETN